MYKGIAFDMDGVILDSEKIYRKYEYEAARHFGLPLDKVEDFCNLIAGGNKKANAITFDNYFKSGIDYYDYRAIVTAGVESHAKEHGYELKPGVKELLVFLKEKGIKIALATSTEKTRATMFLEPHGVLEYFDKMIYGDMISKGKPEPDIYLTACRELGLEPSEVIGVEDSKNGVISSHKAGLLTVLVKDLIPVDDVIKENADYIFDNIISIKDLFD